MMTYFIRVAPFNRGYIPSFTSLTSSITLKYPVCPGPALATFLLLMSGLFISGQAQDQSVSGPYMLSWKADATLIGIGLGTGVTAYILDNHVVPVTPAEINGLDRSRVNAFDRPATSLYSPNAAQISDLTLNAGFVVGGLVVLPAALKARRDWAVVPVMFLETVAVATTVQQTAKNVFPRYRPFDYNPDVPLGEKLTANGKQSFFSGHTGTAFATAVFTSELFRHYFPDSRLKPVVWVVTLGLATTTSLMRYEAGRHFPTDVITGAVFGSFVGWVVPRLHETHNRSATANRFSLQPWSNGQTNGLAMHLTL